MTVSSTTRKAGPYAGNGVTVAFPFAFKVFAAGDVLVVLTDPNGLESELALTTDYTISLNADQNAAPGGTITAVVAPATGYKLTATSQVPNLQPTDITNNGGFYPDVIEDALDRAEIQIQQLRESVSRSMVMPLSSDLSDFQLALGANAAGRADRVIGFDASGYPTLHYASGSTQLGIDLASASGASKVGYGAGTVKSALDSTAATLASDDSRLDALEAESAASIVILSSGQSNMPQAVAYSWSPPPNLYLWNFDGNSQASTVVGTTFQAVNPGFVGPSVAAGAILARENPRAKVYVINVYRGGLGLVNWGPAPPDYNFRQALDGNVPAALATIGRSTIDHFVWGGAESDANAQSQTLTADFESYLMTWLRTKSWFKNYTPTYIFGFTPYAESSPGNSDFLWKRYSGALRACVAVDPSSRSFIDLDDFPRSYFDATGPIPYLHRTGEGYYASGEKLGRTMLTGQAEQIQRSDNLDGVYTSTIAITNLVNCSAVAVGYAYWTRVGNTIEVCVRCSPTITAGGANTTFDISVPVKAKLFPNNVTGHITSANGDVGIVVAVANQQTVQALWPSKFAGAVACCVTFKYRVNHSDILPNSPPGTT